MGSNEEETRRTNLHGIAKRRCLSPPLCISESTTVDSCRAGDRVHTPSGASPTLLTVLPEILMIELPQRRHLHVPVRGLRKTHGITSHITHGGFLGQALLLLLLGMSGRLGKKLLEVFQEIRRCVEQLRNLPIHVLDGLGLSLVRLQDLQELLVDLGGTGEAVLNLVSHLHIRLP